MSYRNLCEDCELAKLIVSSSGSRFLRCLKSKEDGNYAKYPPQPVVRCLGHVQREQK